MDDVQDESNQKIQRRLGRGEAGRVNNFRRSWFTIKARGWRDRVINGMMNDVDGGLHNSSSDEYDDGDMSDSMVQ